MGNFMLLHEYAPYEFYKKLAKKDVQLIQFEMEYRLPSPEPDTQTELQNLDTALKITPILMLMQWTYFCYALIFFSSYR
jgi:hypothetical protein